MTKVLNSTSRPRRSLLKLAAAVAGLWLVVFLLAWLANPLIRKGLPSDVSDQRDYLLVPRSGKYRVNVHRMGDGFGSPWLPHATVKPHRGSLQFMPASGGVIELDFDLTRVAGWIDENRMIERFHWYVDTKDSQVLAEFAEVVALMKAPDFDPAHQPPLTQFSVSMTGALTYFPSDEEATLVNGVWVVLGLIGTTWLVRRSRRKAVRSGFEVQLPASPAAMTLS